MMVNGLLTLIVPELHIKVLIILDTIGSYDKGVQGGGDDAAIGSLGKEQNL